MSSRTTRLSNQRHQGVSQSHVVREMRRRCTAERRKVIAFINHIRSVMSEAPHPRYLAHSIPYKQLPQVSRADDDARSHERRRTPSPPRKRSPGSRPCSPSRTRDVDDPFVASCPHDGSPSPVKSQSPKRGWVPGLPADDELQNSGDFLRKAAERDRGDKATVLEAVTQVTY
jgi:hypothetical protein